MTNPRDTGRYDAFTDSYVDDNVRIDFAWGNLPMQPNDDRGEYTLDPELDSHIIAATQYEGFPAFTPGDPFDDTIANVEVPDLVGLANPTEALNALEDVNLVLGNTNSSTVGATSGNDLNVKSQSIPAGTLVNEGTEVDIVVYDYVVPTNPIAGIRYDETLALVNSTYRYMYLLGRTSGLQVNDYITISGCSVTDYNRPWQVKAVENDDAFNTGGTKVTIANGLISSTDPATAPTAGTWVPGV